MGMMDMFADLENTGKQVAEFIGQSTARLEAMAATQVEILTKLSELAEGHAKLHDQQAEILGWLAEIDDDETEEAIEEVTEAAEQVAEAAEQIAEAAEEIVGSETVEATVAESNSETVAEPVPEPTPEVKEEGKEEILPEPRKEDDKLIETEVAPATKKPAKRKRSFIRV